MPPPAPVVPLAAPAAAPAPLEAPPAPAGDDRFFAPAVLEPVTVTRPPASSGKNPVVIGAIVVIVLAVAIGGFAVLRPGTSSAAKKTPVVLPARAPSNSLPGSLEDVVRIQAESSRQTALAAISEASAEGSDPQVDLHELGQVQPGLTWVTGDVSSTGPHQVSLTQTGDLVTLAIAASSKEVCAFARWQAGTTAQYVTMGNVSSCRAVDAPNEGWSNLAGGSASDLPGQGY